MPGETVFVRGQRWTVVDESQFADCRSLHLTGIQGGAEDAGRTLLLPFDRPRLLGSSSRIGVVRPQRWLLLLQRAALDSRPFGGLWSAVSSRIDLLPYQMEPALAILREGYTRILIADAVGLGKTIQAGLILRQLSAERHSFRALVVTPAGLRGQWASELTERFDVSAEVVTASWLARTARELPADVSPWALPGVYICSFEFIRKPEVLRPLEDTRWDLLIVDEAHVATSRSARRAAVDAVATRSRRVVILTATPHGGDDEEFRELCRIGLSDDRPNTLGMFRRSREDVGIDGRRRTVVLPVRLSEAESHMHRLLERYTALLCAESIRRGDQRARLAAIVLRKRALSSAGSLAVSCRRRMALLTEESAAADEQLLLPLDDDNSLQEDDEPGWILAAPGLANAADERRWLEHVIAAASAAAGHESKTARLVRLLARVKEPVIVFTEYRDTLARLSGLLLPHRPDVAMLHGGMTASERSTTQQQFNQTGSLLLATDAAAEGLNLHHRCRTVIQFELPWSPARLEQRTGRVDRIGQTRPIHEILFVASDTAERLVLAPLATRASRAGTLGAGGPRLLAVLSESRIASAIMEGDPLAPPDTASQLPLDLATIHLRAEADLEAARLLELRRFSRFSTSGIVATGIPAAVIRMKQPAFPPGIVRVCSLTLTAQDGAIVHREIVAVHEPEEIEGVRTPSQVRERIAKLDFWLLGPTALTELLFGERIEQVIDRCVKVAAALRDRERIMCSSLTSAARQLVQAGLFDRRAIRASTERERSGAVLLEDSTQRVSALNSQSRLTPSLKVIAILLVASRRRS